MANELALQQGERESQDAQGESRWSPQIQPHLYQCTQPNEADVNLPSKQRTEEKVSKLRYLSRAK